MASRIPALSGLKWESWSLKQLGLHETYLKNSNRRTRQKHHVWWWQGKYSSHGNSPPITHQVLQGLTSLLCQPIGTAVLQRIIENFAEAVLWFCTKTRSLQALCSLGGREVPGSPPELVVGVVWERGHSQRLSGHSGT